MERSRTWIRPASVAMAVDAVGVLPVFLTGALAIQLREDIGLAVDSLGLVYACYFAAAALLSARLARISERRGPELPLRIGCAIYVVALLGIASGAYSPLVLSGFVALAGVGTALTRTATSVLIARNVVPERQGVAFGLKHCSIPIATLLAGLSVPAIGLTIGWRWAFVVAAVATVTVMLTIPAASGQWQPSPDRGHGDMSRRLLVIAAISFGLGSSAAAALGAYTVSTIVDAGIDEGLAGLLVAAGSIVGLCSRLLVGRWSDRRAGSQLDLVSWMLALGGVGFLMLSTVTDWVMLLAVPVSFATGWAWLGSYNLAMVRLNPVAPGAAVGITQTGAFVGAIIGPAGLGFIAERLSFTAVWVTAATTSFLAAVLIFVLRRFMLGEPGRRELREIEQSMMEL